MLLKRKIACSLFFGLVCLAETFGQYQFENPVVIGKELGFRYNDVRGVKKGDDGFMWMGTSEGICRFDGQQVRIFKLTENLNNPPFDNSVYTVQPMGNEIWAATSQGLSVMNNRDYSFRHYQLKAGGKSDSLKKSIDQQVTFLYKDKFDALWIGTRDRGVGVYDRAKDNFRFFGFSRKEYPALFPALAPDNSILCIEGSQKNDSIIWAGTPSGLQEINKHTGKTRLYTFPREDKDYQVALNAFRRLYHHDDGLIYTGSWAAGVNVFDPATGVLSPIHVKDENGVKIIVKAAIGNICRKSEHEIWISSMAGLALYDTRLKEVTWYKFNNSVENEFYAIDYIDEAGRAWHTDINGLQYFDPLIQQFARYSFKHLTGPDWAFTFYIIPDKTGNIITVCPRMTDGLYRFDKIKKHWSKIPFPGRSFKSEKDAIRGFAQLPSGEYIISADRGMFLFSEKTNKVTMLSDQLPFSPTRRGEIMLDRANNLWISDETLGLIRWTPGTKNYRIYRPEMAPGDTSAAVGRTSHFLEDSRGNIWFQRTGGFAVYIAERDSVETFFYTVDQSNSFAAVFSFAEDKKGRVWISGKEGWLGYALAASPEKGIVYKENRRDRGEPAYLPGLATDNNGDIWGYTSRELFKINADDLTFTTYSFRYGIDDVDYFHFSFLPSGEIIFGGRNDITIARPSELKRNTEIPVPYIDHLEVLNKPYQHVNGTPLALGYDQNFFSIGFSAKAYTMARDVRFRYRLKGFDEWTESGGKRFANYTNVPGGNYTFQLQVANNEGTWNQELLELPVSIAIPWWETVWFRVMAALAIVGITWWVYRFRVAQIRKKEQVRSQYEKKLANVEMSALLAQMNPHFLFNSLNSIDSYIIRNESKQASEYLNNFARLMRLILQNSRSNYISLKDELEALDLYLQMESLRFASRFDYEIKLSPELDCNTVLIPPMLIQPYVENAIWHGLMHQKQGEHGKVEIIISKQDENLHCVIEDNGIGREKAEAIKALKQGSRKRSMGMQITKDRIEMINKLYSANTTMQVVDLHDEDGNASGTRVELVIPV